jgi:hypothetical protein
VNNSAENKDIKVCYNWLSINTDESSEMKVVTTNITPVVVNQKEVSDEVVIEMVEIKKPKKAEDKMNQLAMLKIALRNQTHQKNYRLLRGNKMLSLCKLRLMKVLEYELAKISKLGSNQL